MSPFTRILDAFWGAMFILTVVLVIMFWGKRADAQPEPHRIIWEGDPIEEMLPNYPGWVDHMELCTLATCWQIDFSLLGTNGVKNCYSSDLTLPYATEYWLIHVRDSPSLRLEGVGTEKYRCMDAPPQDGIVGIYDFGQMFLTGNFTITNFGAVIMQMGRGCGVSQGCSLQ